MYYQPVYCVSSISETIVQLLQTKTMLILSPCMAYSGKPNGESMNVETVVVSSDSLQLQLALLIPQAWSSPSTAACTGHVSELLHILEKQPKA